MLNSLREMNATVGKTMPDEIYDLTPKELDYILAGGYQRNYDRLQDLRFVFGNTVTPAAFIDPAKFDDSQIDRSLKKRQKAINAITDEKLANEIRAKQNQQKRFIELLMPDRKGGRS